MPVDQKVLEECIIEQADGDAEMATFLRDRYAKDPNKAAKFVGGFMRTADYTQKSQSLTAERKTLEGQSAQSAAQLETLRKALTDAETEKNTILKEVASRRVTAAKGAELMRILRDKYQLTDDDLPGMSDLIETRQTGKPVDTTEDLDTRFKKFGDDLMTRMETKFAGAMIPELGAMAALPMIWQEINREHMDLTGKALTFAEQQDILKVAREGKSGGLRDVWEEKYHIKAGEWGDGLRMQKRDERLKADWVQDREKTEAAKRSADALNVVTPVAADLGTGPGISPAFKTQFRAFEMDPNKPAQPAGDGVPTLAVQPGQHVRQTGNRGPSGAQRAAAKFLEKSAAGGYGRKTA